jgi:predicted GTPase
MKALVTELIEVLPEERRPALQKWQERLRSTVERSFSDQQDKLEASVEDRQGLGSSRRNGPAS